MASDSLEHLTTALRHALSPARLGSIADSKHLPHAYQHATPFPHAVIDGLFPSSLLAALSREIPDQAAANAGESAGGACKGAGGGTYANARTLGNSSADQWARRVRCWDGVDKNGAGATIRKQSVEDESNMGPATLLTFSQLRGSSFAEFLSRISGIPGLVADPEYFGSGIHVTTRGGLLKVHADFNYHPKMRMRRRVNVFLFINEDWPTDYGGDLELWDRSMTRCACCVAP